MSPAPRPQSRRSSSPAAKPASGRHAAPAAKASSGRHPATTRAAKPGTRPTRAATPPAEADALAPQDLDAAPAPASAGASRRPGSARSARPPAKRPLGTYVIIGLAVVAVIAGLAYTPVMRSIKLGALDKATGAEAIERAKDYLRFEDNSEAMVRDAVRSNHGTFAAQLYLAEQVKCFPALMGMAERKELTAEQLTAVLNAASAVFTPQRHAGDTLPHAVTDWAENHADRAVAIAAMGVAVKHGNATHDKDLVPLLQRIAIKPAQDPLRVTAALAGMTEVVDEDSLGNAIAVLRSGASDQAIADAAFTAKIRATARPDHLGTLVELLDHPAPAVRALALEILGGLTMPPDADPQARQDLGQRIAAKLVPATPAVELAAALKATAGLRLTGARDAVLALLPQRAQLALPDVDEAWWADCLGRALILTQPPTARPASEELIGKLGAALASPTTRPVAAKALALVGDRNFLALRPTLDQLAELGTDPDCFTALTTLVKKAYDRPDVVKSCGDDLTRWKNFLALDRPRSARAAAIRTFVDAHRQDQTVAAGREKLKATQAGLESAAADLQGWLDDKSFVPPLGMSQSQVEGLLQDVNLLHKTVNAAMPGLN
jgi:hypothetical protein